MPLVVRQALASRLSALPELQAFLADVSLLAGVSVRFWPATPVEQERAPESGLEPVGLCAKLAREPAGGRLCVSCRQELRGQAQRTPAEASCDAGLVEVLVPVVVGGVLAGHFLAAGLRDGADTAKAVNRARHLLARSEVDWPAEKLAQLRANAPECDGARRQALARVLLAGAEKVGRAMTEHLVIAPPGVPAVVERAYRIVHAEYARALRVPALARQLGLSAAHLSRVFHHATGLRLVDYVARYRAERARALLTEDAARPVAEVARACGFASISQFNRVFKTTFGASPRSLCRPAARKA